MHYWDMHDQYWDITAREGHSAAVVLPMTLIDAIIHSLSQAGEYNRDDMVAPAMILWPDKERQWEPLLPMPPANSWRDCRCALPYKLKCIASKAQEMQDAVLNMLGLSSLDEILINSGQDIGKVHQICTFPSADYILGFTGSHRTMRKVQRGPKNSEANHQANPLRPLLWASPALISDRVNHPTAYPPTFCEMGIFFNYVFF
jgi:hypothetical protein